MLELRPFTPEHVEELISWATSPEFVVQWAGSLFTFPLTAAQFAYLDDDPTVSRLLPLGAFRSDGSRLLGYAELRNIDHAHRSALVTRVIVSPEERGRGVGAEMMREVLRIGFEKLNLHRIGLGVFDFNLPAIACYEAVGFRREGIERDSKRVGDQYWSLIRMSVLEDEWRANGR